METSELVTIHEAHSLTGCPVVTIRYWAQRGHVRATKVGRAWLLHRLDVLAFAAGRLAAELRVAACERRRGGGRR
jgi:excisionase family DNA binding protein